ncbi:MAG: DNA-directed polymerase Heat shock sigma 32 [Rickettsiaceae bacterium]|nr:DNA-directed polymerase Heat shock sigma 32 [Rickettsiaceae bacterium]
MTTKTMTLPVLSGDLTLSSYLEKVNKLPYLTPEEELSLANDFSLTGNVEAAHKLVTSHLRLVVKIAAGFRNYGLPMLELISEGNIGLMQAVKKFDASKGFRLSTYAMWWIKAAMQEYVLHSWSLVKIGTTAAQKKLFFNLRKIKSRLEKIDNRSLSPKEIAQIAQELDVSEREVMDMDSRLSQADQSLNAPIMRDEEAGEMIDLIPARDPGYDVVLAENQDMKRKKAMLVHAMSTLNEREREIITARRLQEEPATLEDLSKAYNISRERVRQIENRAMEKLQAAVTN